MRLRTDCGRSSRMDKYVLKFFWIHVFFDVFYSHVKMCEAFFVEQKIGSTIQSWM